MLGFTFKSDGGFAVMRLLATDDTVISVVGLLQALVASALWPQLWF